MGEEKRVDDAQDNDNDHEQEVDHKASRGEKKFKKSLTKMGMKQVTGINRVTLKTNKNFVLYIEDPDILKSPENSYVIFGEAKFLDFTNNLAGEKAQNLAKKTDEAQIKETKQEVETKVVEEDGEEETEEAGDLPEESITQLMEYSGCSRAKAIKYLKKTNGDIVEAITLSS